MIANPLGDLNEAKTQFSQLKGNFTSTAEKRRVVLFDPKVLKAVPVMSQVKLIVLIFGAALFVLSQAASAALAGSLTLLSVSNHLVADLLRFLICALSVYGAHLPPTRHFPQGLIRLEPVAELFGTIISLCLTTWMFNEAVNSLLNGFHAKISVLLTLPCAIYTLAATAVVSYFINGRFGLELLHPGRVTALQHAPLVAMPQTEQPGVIAEEVPQTHSIPQVVAAETQEQNPIQMDVQIVGQTLKLQVPGITQGLSNVKLPKLKRQEVAIPAAYHRLLLSENHREKTFWLHVLTDILHAAAGVVVGLIVAILRFPTFIDPLVALFFCFVHFMWALPALKETIFCILEKVPEDFDIEAFRLKLLEIQYVKGVHALHARTISQGQLSLTAHIVCLALPAEVLSKANTLLQESGIRLSSIQVELEDQENPFNCPQNTQASYKASTG